MGMRVPRSVPRLVALAAIAVGGGTFAASVGGVAEVGASLDRPATEKNVRVDFRGDCHPRHDDLRKL